VNADESGKRDARISGAEEKQQELEGGIHEGAFVVVPPIAGIMPSYFDFCKPIMISQ